MSPPMLLDHGTATPTSLPFGTPRARFARGVQTQVVVFTSATLKGALATDLFYGNASSVRHAPDRRPAESQGTQAWLGDYMSYLDELASPSHSWDAHEGEPPSGIAIESARLIGELLFRLNFPPDRLAPSADDGITLSFAKADRMAAIECFNSGEVVFLTTVSSGSPDVWEGAPDAGALLEEIRVLRDFIEQ